jgi:anti-sigma-K factor RskA
MSRNETEQLTQDNAAFDYVSGVLRGKARKDFTRQLQNNTQLQTQVQFWEEQLINLSDTSATLAPHAKTWAAIETRIKNSAVKNTTTHAVTGSVQKWLLWFAPSLLTAIVVSGLFLFIPAKNTATFNADYMAVLTDSQGEPLLSALTASTNNTMKLTWSNSNIAANKNLQLWAISKRDGQTRPIAVFASAQSGPLTLAKANLRLVKEAATLMLTEEDIGGSAIDEPSEIILAKGACVLLATDEKTI